MKKIVDILKDKFNAIQIRNCPRILLMDPQTIEERCKELEKCQIPFNIIDLRFLCRTESGFKKFVKQNQINKCQQ